MTMAKTPAQLDADIKAQLGLGQTRSGKTIPLPTKRPPQNMNDVAVFRRVRSRFKGWTKADHADAERVYHKAANDEGHYGTNAILYRSWAAAHWDLGRVL